MVICLDIGGTSIKLGFADRLGSISDKREVSVCFDSYCTPILQTAIMAVEDMLALHSESVEGIAVSATGQVDDRIGKVIGTNGKIPNYEGSNFKTAFEQKFQLPTWVINDANAAVLGECCIGAARGVQNAVMITLGTGVGGGIVIGGKLYSGMRGIAGELGHFTLYQNGEICQCGKRGCFENYASTTALVRRVKAATGKAELDGRQIFAMAKNGDSVVIAEINAWLDDVAAGITGLVHIFNPEMVIIGGGVSSQEELLMVPLRNKVFGGIMPRFAEGLKIESALLGNDAGMIGAAKYFYDKES